jgi:hydrogenase/urease accessory protein HupE
VGKSQPPESIQTFSSSRLPVPFLSSLAIFLLAFGAARAAEAHAVGVSKGAYVAAGSRVSTELVFARPELARSVEGLDSNGDGELDDLEVLKGGEAVEKGILHRILVLSGGVPCKGALESVSVTQEDGVLVRGRHECPSVVSDLSVELPLLAVLSHGHRHFARVEMGQEVREDVLYRGHEQISITGSPPASDSIGKSAPPRFLTFFRMGVEHILTGYDHLIFLLGLVIVGGRVRALVGVVTAFTIAHSITLGLAALNVFCPPPRVVEAAIALSIVYVGVENFFVSSAERRWRITFPFGLVHGFGFASALREVSLSRAEIPVVLLSFNLGVEAGQLAVLAVVLPIVLVLRKKGLLAKKGTRALSAAVALMGAIWFVERVVA